MLYKKRSTPHLDMELFRSPSSEYRGTPFWAWNCKLEEKDLCEQIDVLKKMGFGGFHMHSRAGMGSTYLGEEFMHMVRACVDKAKKEEMLAWLYDEDRWPSGFAGGYVTKDKAMRSRCLLFTETPKENVQEREDAVKHGGVYLLAVYDVCLDAKGGLTAYRRIGAQDEAKGAKWYVYVCSKEDSGRYNGQAYVDTLSKEAMRRFIEITYAAYEKEVGADFDGSVPAIFTDEPQFEKKTVAAFGTSTEETKLPFTPDFPETYAKAYGEDLLDRLPELRWDNADGSLSVTRYRYHDHICERFCEAFVDQCGAWCDEHGIALTGHMMEEQTLESQTHSLGETMRCYRKMKLPGIDLLSDHLEYMTAKQCQSAVHQYGREGMLSELYGVTGWHFDFRSHKFQGDWQAALGVTVRVPHLSWVTMKGSGKRDYPASIHYQAPWHNEYRLIEDHFARVATVLTRGKPVVRVGVIHPIESFWMIYGPNDTSYARKKEMEERFSALTERLLFGLTDFNFISESLLPELYRQTDDARFAVGAMAYDAIVVPELITIRSETLRDLTAFADKGGKLIFIGKAPTHVDGVRSDAAESLYRRALHVSGASCELLTLLDVQKEISAFDGSGAPIDDLVYQMRETAEERYLFLARGRHAPRLDTDLPRDVFLHIRGNYRPTLLNTQTGEEETVAYRADGNETVLFAKMGMSDSLLLRLAPTKERMETAFPVGTSAPCFDRVENSRFQNPKDSFFAVVKSPIECTLSEPNVLLLDMAEWSEDGKHFHETDEILRIDKKLRTIYGYPMADGRDVQPWVIPDDPIDKFPVLRFRFTAKSEMPLTLAYEELCEAELNGEQIPVIKNGYYVDKKIFTMPLPPCRVGENILTLRVPIGKRVSIENFFLLGDFDLRREKGAYVIDTPCRTVGFGSLTEQGMPFYGGNVRYKTTFEAPAGKAEICVSHYRGALMRVFLDGEDKGALIYSPYKVEIPDLTAGEHTLEIVLYGNRANTFGALHLADESVTWLGPIAWYSVGAQYSYEYQLKSFGILKAPTVTVYPK